MPIAVVLTIDVSNRATKLERTTATLAPKCRNCCLNRRVTRSNKPAGRAEVCVSVNNEIIIVTASFFQLSAMILEPRGLLFQVTNTGPREGVCKHMREGYGQTKEYATDNDRTDDIGCVCEVVVSQYRYAAIGLESHPVQNRAQDWQVVDCGDVGAGA